MKPIRYEILTLHVFEQQMQRLASELASSKYNPPSTVGGGQTVQEMELLAEEYQAVHDALYELIQKTDAFLATARSNMLQADQSLSDSFSGIASTIGEVMPHPM